MAGIRMEKINKQVTREVGMILQREFSDPRFPFISITRSDVSPDLRNAKIYFSYLGNDQDIPKVEVSLSRVGGKIRKMVGDRMKTRRVPELTFHYDESIAAGDRIERLIQEINNEDEDERTEKDS